MSDVIVCVVRHAEAGERTAWRHPDAERPLTPRGRRQAEMLVERFADLPLTQLLSSPYLRCVQTLEPLGASRALPIELRDELAEGGSPAYVEKLVLEAATEGAAALCVHGDGLQALLLALVDRDVHLAGELTDQAKGSTWYLRVVDGVIRSGRYEPPPT